MLKCFKYRSVVYTFEAPTSNTTLKSFNFIFFKNLTLLFLMEKIKEI